MSVVIRLRRMGAHKKPFYRLVAADSRMPRNGRFLEELGTYDPLKEPAAVQVNDDRIKTWLNQGAKMSDTVRRLLKRSGIPAGQSPAA
ncbi:MAG: 30S ribosomal protein S16 [Nitrospirae bacterium]|nr:30S ribosomal protein S16 [Nitrospirota bacterium]